MEEDISKKGIVIYIISIIIFALSFMPIFSEYKVVAYLLVVLLSGYELLFKGIKNIFNLNFEEDTLMTIAVIAAFVLGEFPESCMVILLYRLGEFIEDKAVDNSNKNIKDIVEIKSKTANVIDENGNEKIVNVEDVTIGEKILVKPGEMVPLDCTILSGESSLDMSNLTGESKPIYVTKNEKLLSGTINLDGSLECMVDKDYKNSTSSKIVDLVYEAQNNKGRTEDFITKFSKIYTPIVIILAIIIAIIPPIIFNDEFKKWILRGLVFLVASCPCSIVISVPLAFFSCIGAISKKGMIVKGTKHIENLSKASCIAFDKTGTITTGKMEINQFESLGNYTQEELLKYLYALERKSNHPISTAIKQKVENSNINTDYTADKYKEIAGCGIKAVVNNKKVLFGNYKILEEINPSNFDNNTNKNANYIIIDGSIEGFITFKEQVRENIKNALSDLKKININRIVMLTGDNAENAKNISNEIGIKEFYSSLLPKEKLEKMEKLKKQGKVIFIGDGINDSPVLAESDFGISMGEGTQIAASTSDGILISNNLEVISTAIKIARKTMKIIKENIVFSLLAKVIVLMLGIIGVAPVWLAVAADTGVSLLTVLNSLRIIKNKNIS